MYLIFPYIKPNVKISKSAGIKTLPGTIIVIKVAKTINGPKGI